MAGATADLVLRKASGEWFHPPRVSRVLDPNVVTRALRVGDIDTCAAGNSGQDLLQLTRETQREEPVTIADCTVKDIDEQLNNTWLKQNYGNHTLEDSELHRHQRWVTSAGIDNSKWFKPAFITFRSRLRLSDERSLLWQTMLFDGRFGYRVRAELRPTTAGEAVPYPATDLGETMEHANDTRPGQDELCVWPAENCVGPHILSGLLGVIRLKSTYRPAKLAKEELERLHAWWSLIRAEIRVVLEAERHAARRGIEKYKECVLQRLCERVLGEVLRMDDIVRSARSWE
jgi:hypothetical protein